MCSRLGLVGLGDILTEAGEDNVMRPVPRSAEPYSGLGGEGAVASIANGISYPKLQVLWFKTRAMCYFGVE